MAMTMTCNVCIEDSKSCIVCTMCKFTACKSCTRRYLIESINDAMCMSCKVPYGYEFIETHIGKTWHRTLYKTSRKNVLLDRERVLTPQAMTYIEQCTRVYELQNEQRSIMLNPDSYEPDRLQQVRILLVRARRALYGWARPNNDDDDNTTQPPPPVQTLYSKCPVETCLGVLNTDRVCVTCHTRTCHSCFEIVVDDNNHACDPNTVETIKMLRADTKPCPQCATPIHKIEGCYQMWCTKCHTTFHYRTLEILHETIHNPHYVQWMQQNPGVGNDDDPMDNFHNEQQLFIRLRELDFLIPDTQHMCAEVIRSCLHVDYVTIPDIRNKFRRYDDTNIRRMRLANFLRGYMSPEYMQMQLYSEHKQRQRWTTLMEMWATFAQSLRVLIDNVFIDLNIEEFLRQVGELVLYINSESVRINSMYKNKAHQIVYTYDIPLRTVRFVIPTM